MKEFQDLPTTIEGGISDATKSYLDMLYFSKQEMLNSIMIPKDIAQDFSAGSLSFEAQFMADLPIIIERVGLVWKKQMQELSLDAKVTLSTLKDFKILTRKQVKFPKSKVKRIRRKWAKQEKNYKLVEVNLTFKF